ncbi:hypothetical protein LA6_001159 [Marinibacterium anthonyi]|nr:hypothetical protein LA6_001159 [Marinibacterium anthonyi]
MCAADAPPHTHSVFDEFWEAYPRTRNREATERVFAEALQAGAEPSAIIAGAKGYAAENADNGRQYIAFSDNWLRNRRWLDYAPQEGKPKADAAAFWASAVTAGKFIPQSAIQPHLAREIIARRLATPAQLKAVGVEV